MVVVWVKLCFGEATITIWPQWAFVGAWEGLARPTPHCNIFLRYSRLKFLHGESSRWVVLALEVKLFGGKVAH